MTNIGVYLTQFQHDGAWLSCIHCIPIVHATANHVLFPRKLFAISLQKKTYLPTIGPVHIPSQSIELPVVCHLIALYRTVNKTFPKQKMAVLEILAKLGETSQVL